MNVPITQTSPAKPYEQCIQTKMPARIALCRLFIRHAASSYWMWRYVNVSDCDDYSSVMAQLFGVSGDRSKCWVGPISTR